MSRSHIRLASAVAATVMFAAGAQAQGRAPFAADTIVVADLPYTPFVGTSMPLSAQVWEKGSRAPMADAKVMWEVENIDRAWVAENGFLTLLKPGKVRLIGHYTDFTRTLRVVRTIDIKANPAVKVELSAANAGELHVGDTLRVTAQVLDADKKPVDGVRVNYAVAARGLPQGAASITAHGRFVASRPGVHTVIAQVGKVADVLTLTVLPSEADVAAAAVPVQKIEIADVAYEPVVGTSMVLAARVDAASAVRVTWASSNPEVAVVDQNGVVAFRKHGRVAITATAGAKTAEKKFAVQRQLAADLVLSATLRDVRVGDEVKLRDDAWQMGGVPVRGMRANYAVIAHDANGAPAPATISDERVFVATQPGIYTIITEAGGLADATTLVVRARETGAAVGTGKGGKGK